MSYVLLIARQRTGTGALNSALEKHPNIKYLNELFNQDNTRFDTSFHRFYEKEVKGLGKKTWPNIRSRIFDRYIKVMHDRYQRKTLIADVKYNNLHHLDGNWRGLIEMPMLLQETMQKGLPILHLTRRNRLRTFLSGLIADLNRVWHTADRREIRHASAVVDTGALCNYLDVTDKEDQLMAGWIGHYDRKLEFDYADLFVPSGGMNEDIVRAILDMMGQPYVPGLQPSIVKQAPISLTDSIANLEDVQRALAGTPHEWMLRD